MSKTINDSSWKFIAKFILVCYIFRKYTYVHMLYIYYKN